MMVVTSAPARLFAVLTLACAVSACDSHKTAEGSAPAALATGSAEQKAAPFGVTASPAASAARDSETRCQQLCSHTQSLHCGTPESCKAGCRQMLDSDICRSEMLAFFDCGQKQPVDRWECDQGIPSLKDGYCNESQAAFFGCIQSSAVTAKGAPN